ncbi:hypothetical protein POZ13_11515, partial [Bacteroides uniformis]|uniref:hypothetical protein n=5 Tax=Bacteroidales TaxID=171549 RepID=UPI00233F069C
AGKLKAPAYLLYPHPQCVTLEDVCYLCCHSRNDFIPPVKTGIKSTKNPLPGIAKQGYFYIGIKGVGLF